MPERKSKSSVPSVEKAFDVLELLAESDDGMTMNEMVVALGRTMGEIYRIVVYLAERGYLHQDTRTSRYALTLQLFELSHRHDPTARLISNAQPILERVAASTDQSCHLGVLNRSNVLVLSSVQSPKPAGYSVRTGSIFSVDRTSSGHVILAFSPEDRQKRYIAHRSQDQRDAIRQRLARIRSTGYEDTPSTMIVGVRNLCAPVFDSQGIAAAITSGFISQIDQVSEAEDVLKELRRCALELSASLGFRAGESQLIDVLDPDRLHVEDA